MKFDPGAAARAYYARTPTPIIIIISEPRATPRAANNVDQGDAIRGAARSQHNEASATTDTVPSTTNNRVITACAPHGPASRSAQPLEPH